MRIGRSKTGKDVLKQKKYVLKQENNVLKHFWCIFACQMTQFTVDDTLRRLIFQVHFFAPIEYPPDLEHLYWWAPYLDLEHPILIWNTQFWFQTSILISNTLFTEKLHKMKLYKKYIFSSKFNYSKLELSPQNIHNGPILSILFDWSKDYFISF